MAGYVIIAILFFLIGGKYREFSDVMLARRIARLIKSSDNLQKDQSDYERAVKIDQSFGKRKAMVQRCNFCNQKSDNLKMGLCDKCQEMGE